LSKRADSSGSEINRGGLVDAITSGYRFALLLAEVTRRPTVRQTITEAVARKAAPPLVERPFGFAGTSHRATIGAVKKFIWRMSVE
jgi:hypothetical protein